MYRAYMDVVDRAKTPLALMLYALSYILVNLQALYGMALYVIPSIIGLSILVIHLITGTGDKSREEGYSVAVYMLLASAIIWLGLGAVFGFGLNLLAVSIIQYLAYLAYRLTGLLAAETIRRILIERMSFYTISFKYLMGVSGLIALMLVPLTSITSLSSDAIPTMMILFSQGMLFTVVSWKYGFGPQLAVAVPTVYMTKLAPIVPDMPFSIMWLALILITLIQALILYIASGGGVLERLQLILKLPVHREKLSKAIEVFDKMLAVLAIAFMVGFLIGYRALAIASGSMQPTLNIGDVAIVNVNDRSDIKEGDIIAFVVKDKLVIHRVVRVFTRGNETLYITQGDANNAPDPWVLHRDNIVGKYVARVPAIGFPSLLFMLLFKNTITGIAVSITAILSLFTSYMLREVVYIP